jgi:hypothetical protein
MELKQEFIIDAATGKAFIMQKGERVKIIDVEGKQVADFMAFTTSAPHEYLSTGATIDANSSLFITEGDTLFSNYYHSMLLIEEDTVKRHDLLYPACSPAMYRVLFNIKEDHPNCRDNLAQALRPFSINLPSLFIPFNIFMNVTIASDGSLTVQEPLSRPGDFISLRAYDDLIVAIAACAEKESRCNAGRCTSLQVQLFSP